MKKVTRFYFALATMFALATVAVLAQPATSAPTPPALSPGNVISIFSDAYTNVSGTDFFPNWGQVTAYTPLTIGTADHIIKYSNMNYQGIQFGSTQICTNMKYLHLDVWTNDANAATLPVGLIWTGGEKTVTKAVATNGSWTSLDIPLSEFTGAILSSVIQFKFQSNEWLTLGAAGSSAKYTTVYLDNVYFWSDAAADTQAPTGFTATAAKGTGSDIIMKLNATDNSGTVNYTITYGTTTLTTSGVSGVEKVYTITGLTGSTAYSFSVTCKDAAGNSAANSPVVVPITTGAAMSASPTPTCAAVNVKSIYSDFYTAAVTVPSWDNWYNCPISGVKLADNGNALIFNIATGGVGGTGGFTPIDVSNMTYLHVDVYPTTATTIGVCLVAGSASSYISLGTLTANQWNSRNIALTNYTGFLTAVKQVGFNSPSTGVFYMDNLFFSSGSASAINDVVAAPAINCYTKSGKLIVSCQSEMKEISVRNILGQNIRTEAVNSNSKIIDLSGLTTGNYIVVAKLTNGQLSTQKFIK